MMDKRDLKTDLAEKWLEKALAEKERADKYEALVRESVVVLERMKFLSEEGFMIDETDYYALEQTINKAKEALGDDANM